MMLRCATAAGRRLRGHALAAARGPRHLSAATSSVLTWGEGSDGQLGHFPFERSGMLNSYAEMLPRELKDEAGAPILFAHVACGTSHSLAVDGAGALWSWGKPKYGELGHGTDEETPKPKRVQGVEGVKFTSVACGEFHSAAIDSQGLLWTWGYGGSWVSGGGHLGHGDQKSLNVPTVVKAVEAGGYFCKSVCCGEAHTAILTSDGEVLSCGAGEHGRNGNGSSRDVTVPEPVDYLESSDILQLEAGSAFTLALDSAGQIHCWGRNDQGQLGVGGGLQMDVYSMEDVPRVVESNGSPLLAMSVAAGHSHATCVTLDGGAFVWGMKNNLEPARVVFEDPGTKIKRAYAGSGYTLYVAEDDATHSAGLGRTCCLGHGDKKGYAHPIRVAALDDYIIKAASAGYRHVAAIVTCK
ncbi:regulator of chromosome condensation 1/beta-lactamase-inhibitor protein II [Pelagophyceae sp. CCMP2097]|nr:regulator of chromosome condensation 1/beta-lactamase-inhibitor protein II [Pelagophyceae sp. CCMP2097]